VRAVGRVQHVLDVAFIQIAFRPDLADAIVEDTPSSLENINYVPMARLPGIARFSGVHVCIPLCRFLAVIDLALKLFRECTIGLPDRGATSKMGCSFDLAGKLSASLMKNESNPV
jgi:hypothetical protein